MKVSILLTSYNHADYLEKSIDSILNQTYKDFELYVVDDCSTDESWNIINKYKDKRIKKIRNKVNKGSILTPKLVDKFKGEYLAIAHCDDMWAEDKLEKQVELLDNNKEYAACFTWVKIIDEANNEISSDNYIDFNVKNRSRFEWLNHFFYKGNCLCHPSVLLRLDVQKKDHLYTRGLGALPDFYRWVKICLKHDIYIYPEKLSCFRVRKSGINTSGYNESNIIRVSYDNYKIFDLYRKLSRKDFLKTFPECEKYVVNGYFNQLFVFGKLCMDNIGLNNYRLYGLNCIYESLQDLKSAKLIEKNYNYTIKSFISDSGKKDIFSVINKENINVSTLYYANDNDYCEDNKICKKYICKNDGTFDILFDHINMNVSKIRLDPDEGKFQKYSNIKIYVNDTLVDYKCNGFCNNKDEYEFYDLDPQFELQYNGFINKIYIKGICKSINYQYAINKYKDYIYENSKETIIEEYKSKKVYYRFINKIKKILNSIKK